MVAAKHTPMSEDDRIMTDRFESALKEFLVGKSVVDAALLLECINKGLKAAQRGGERREH